MICYVELAYMTRIIHIRLLAAKQHIECVSCPSYTRLGRRYSISFAPCFRKRIEFRRSRPSINERIYSMSFFYWLTKLYGCYSINRF